MNKKSVTIIDGFTVYAPGYSKERLEREDHERTIGAARLQKKFDCMVKNHDRWERVQKRSFFIFLACFPEAAIWGWFLGKPVSVLVLIILQAILAAISMIKAGGKMETCEGPLE